MDENNRPVIWGAIIAGLLVILSVAALYFYYQRNANKQPENQEKTEEQPLTPPANEEREVPTVPLEDQPKPKQEEQVVPQQKTPVSGPETNIY